MTQIGAGPSTQVKETTEDRLQQLEKDKDDAVQAEDYEKAAQIRDEINKIKWATQETNEEVKTPNFMDQAQKAIDEAAAEEHKKEITEATAKEEQDKEAQIKELTDKLNNSTEKNDKLEKDLKLLKEWLAKIREDRTNKIDEIKNANTSDMDRLKAELKNLQEEKAKIENDFFGKTNFEDNINTEDIKKITSRMLQMGVSETDKRWRKKVTAYEKMPVHMVRRRMTLKTIATAFNEIKDNRIQGVDFVMAFSKTRLGRYGRMENKMARRKMLRKVKIGRNLETFGAQYNKQKEKIMAVITWGSKIEDLPPEEQVVLKAIDKRIDYYGKQYLQDIYNQKTEKPDENAKK